MTDVAYQVKTASFEGPLDVLLSLIEKRKLFINEISLASITDDFIQHVQKIDKKDIESYAAFISVAATLILIKSRSLIPNLELTAEEEQDIGALERRLELYQLIKEIGSEIQEKFGKQIVFPRLENNIEMKVFVPDAQITIASMQSAVIEVLKAMPEPEEQKPEIVVMKMRSLEETITDLLDRVKKSIKMSFKEFSASGDYGNHKEKKVGVIVSFLAMLELVRQGFMDAFQDEHFTDISLHAMSENVNEEVTPEENI